MNTPQRFEDVPDSVPPARSPEREPAVVLDAREADDEDDLYADMPCTD